MKTLITFLILLFASFAKAQVVNIPDAKFKTALISMGVDTNNDGEIQQTEALAVTNMVIYPFYPPITDLTGIRAFTNLKILGCKSHEITSLDVSGLNQLKRIDCSHNRLVSLNTNGCSSLQTLIGEYNNLKNVNLSGYPNIDTVNLYRNDSLDVFNAANCPRLKWADLSGAWAPGYYGSMISLINLVNCDSLTMLNLYGRYIDLLDISGSDRITDVGVPGIVKRFIAKNCSSLSSVVTSGSSTSSISHYIDVTGCINLTSLSAGEAGYLTNIDLSSCPNLRFLSAVSLRSLYVNLKNGTRMNNCALYVYNDSIPRTLTVCADDFEIDSIYAWVHRLGPLPLLYVNSYCSFTPAGAYNSIRGNVRLDVNNNGCDSNDRKMHLIPIKVTNTTGNSFLKYTETDGSYEHYFYTGNFTLRPYFPYPYFIVTPATATANFDTANNLIATRDFCIQPNGIHNDLEITLLPIAFARPGFDAGYTLVYKNRGTTTLSGNATINFDNSRMNFVSASENISTQSTGQLTWNYNNLQPLESRTMTVIFNLLPPPVNNIGDTITYLAAITPSANDETQFDNSFILPQLVRGSMDPNEKQCMEGSKLDIGKIGDYLHYQVHFQNEGTDTAFNIVVADTLSDKLDWNSFELISSSHPVDVKLTDNKTEFIFQNINLPYKFFNEAASNGWVAFKIKPKPSVVIGDSLNNKAAIYFDFNKPVITNTATTIVSSSFTPVPVKLEYLSVNSSNNTNMLNWKATCTYGNAKFGIERSDDGIHFSSIGNVNATSLRCQLPFNFTDENPVAGKNYYRLKITDADGISFYSKTLVVGNNKAGITITSVAGNTVYLNSNKQQVIQLKIIAADGKEILNERKTIIAGSNNINLQMKNAAKGIYTLIVYSSEGSIITGRFIK